MRHPLVTWLQTESDLASQSVEKPEQADEVGKAIISAWNAAIDKAADQVVPDGNPMFAKHRILGLRYDSGE